MKRQMVIRESQTDDSDKKRSRIVTLEVRYHLTEVGIMKAWRSYGMYVIIENKESKSIKDLTEIRKQY